MKYKNHINKICRQISYYEREGVIHPDIARCLRDLLKEIENMPKQEDKKECDNPGEEKQQIKIYCRECGKPMFIDFDSGVNLCNTCYERGLNPKSPSLLNDIETIEEIEEYCNRGEVSTTINMLIKNQRILTEVIKSLLIK